MKLKKLGLALSGGGAKGFAHAGALKAMEEFGLKPDIISGTSAGSVVGALYSAGYHPNEIYQLFLDKDFNKFAEFTIPKAGIFNPNRFMQFLKSHLSFENLEDLPIPLYVVATDLDNGKSVTFSTGAVTERVMASCCIPVVFTPIEIDGIHYVDGGLFKNFPVSTIRNKCEKVIGINVSPLMPNQYKQTIWNIAERSYHYMFKANTMEDRTLCDILVEMQDVTQFSTFDLDNIEKIFQLGYDIMKKELQKTDVL